MYKIHHDTFPQQAKTISSAEMFCRDLLRTDSVLNINEECRILSLLRTQFPSVLAQQRFTKNEWTLLMTLLNHYPFYAPHEVLLASLTSLSSTECRERLQEAQSFGSVAVTRELKPVYRALSAARVKLAKLCPYLKISIVRDAGYVITAAQQEDVPCKEI